VKARDGLALKLKTRMIKIRKNVIVRMMGFSAMVLTKNTILTRNNHINHHLEDIYEQIWWCYDHWDTSGHLWSRRLFLHELCHIMQLRTRGYWRTWRDYFSTWRLPHDEQKLEIEADKFADAMLRKSPKEIRDIIDNGFNLNGL
jgi:hypothetical protein